MANALFWDGLATVQFFKYQKAMWFFVWKGQELGGGWRVRRGVTRKLLDT